MRRFKLFIENFLVYGLGGAIGKIIPFIMLPIVTRLMPNTYYFGINDISNVLVSFGSSIAIMGMYDAMFRTFFDEEDLEFKKTVCSTTLVFTGTMSVFVFLVLIILKNSVAKIFFGNIELSNLVVLSAVTILVSATNTIISAPTRMQNKKGIYLLINTISSIISYSITIPLLLKGYYIIALPVAALISGFSVEIIFWILNHKWFSVRKFNFRLMKQMLIFAIPLVPNVLIYWIFNSCDRLMITNMLGSEYTGIYAIGAKIGQLSQLIYTAFAGGWQFFAFSTMKDSDQVSLISKVFEYLGIVTYISTACEMLFNNVFFSIVFEGDYQQGAEVAPYLFMAPLLLMLFQVAGGQFLIIKITWPASAILGVGLLFNILINWLGIKYIGIEGAAIGTLAGYAISIILAVVVLQKKNLIKVNKRFYLATLLMIIYMLGWRCIYKNMFVLNATVVVCLILLFFVMYYADFKEFFLKRKAD